MRTTIESTNTKSSTPNYSASVPLHVYRELVTELQAIQAKLDVVTAHNQKLVQENQVLYQEITKVTQSFAHLQKLVDSSVIPRPQPTNHQSEVKNTPNPQPTNHQSGEIPIKKLRPPQPSYRPQPPTIGGISPSKNRRKEVSAPVIDVKSPNSKPVFKEQQVRYYAPTESDLKGMNGWWLVITILLIMVTGFSAGYLIVRPIFQQQSQNQ
ncbi:hypothetical protein VB711_01045 [Cronbergia sp. UHCC 0137]|uniref:hypothetical protein n=1 Tax=Cronbergia sp. UHCC 0137 TaxID=3110239 RepID=UPI002B216D49|nr:hypothetical protein [Cronbergia sp. UHCC 0137]MEA5616430.1 hypothetical protein [Cronbergia sp. UHCC 0137]